MHFIFTSITVTRVLCVVPIIFCHVPSPRPPSSSIFHRKNGVAGGFHTFFNLLRLYILFLNCVHFSKYKSSDSEQTNEDGYNGIQFFVVDNGTQFLQCCFNFEASFCFY